MELMVLTRTRSSNQGTFGIAYVHKNAWWYSLELPWMQNMQGISCIPTGRYLVKWTKSPSFGRFTYQIMGVPNRAGIRIHSGNFAGLRGKYKSNSLGCPLFGKKVGILQGQLAVLNSAIATRQFERYFNKKSFILEVRNA